MTLRRRHLNHAALALALTGWNAAVASAPPVRASPRWKNDPFTLGVASGQPRERSVVLWTRLLPADLDELQAMSGSEFEVRYEVFADEALRDEVARGEIQTNASRGFSVHALVQGLVPGRSYWYRFRSGSAASRIGRTCTAPAASAVVPSLRLALGSCQHYEQGFFAAHREIAGSDLDLVVFVGDYIYEGSNPNYSIRRHGTYTPHSLDDYRARHALYKQDADLQAAHAAHPWILTWDDHEVVNDYAGERDPAYSEPGRFLRRRAAAYRAYFEHMPIELPPSGSGMRIHDRFRWGALAEIWTLDCRQHRSTHACADPGRDVGRMVADCAELQDPSRSMLGMPQERWLAEGLAASAARWKLLAQSTQMSSTGIDTPQGREVWTDGWDGYPDARRRLLQSASEAGVQDLVVLGGDVHRTIAADLRLRPNDSASPIVASEFVGGSVTSRGASSAAMNRMQRDNPDVRHARGDERGYALLELSAGLLGCRFRTTPHPALESATLATQAEFVVESGRAGVRRA
ncbi:Alkaline phosphatase D [Burkholderiales bacterium 8X]|nr:Alkaline phosphatase D [Burkholderiales bacterium 8X]